MNELWKELRRAAMLAPGSLDAQSVWIAVADRARALLCGPEPTREEILAWYNTNPNTVQLLSTMDIILAALRHFRRAPAEVELPQCYGWTEEQWRKAFGNTELIRRNDAARVAHRLAQPLPKVDPDAEAKRVAWEFYSIMTPGKFSSKEEMWCDLGPELWNGWRAVAKEVDNGID